MQEIIPEGLAKFSKKISLFSIVILLSGCSILGTKKKKNSPNYFNNMAYYETGNTNYPAIVADKNGSWIELMNNVNGYKHGLIYEDTNQNNYVMYFDNNNNRPQIIYVNGVEILFGNYNVNNKTVDLAILYQGKTKIVRNIPFDFSTFQQAATGLTANNGKNTVPKIATIAGEVNNSSSASTSLNWIDTVNRIGTIAGLGICAVGVGAASGADFGITLPIAIGCGAALFHTVSILTENNSQQISQSSDLIGTSLDIAGCGTSDPASCALAINAIGTMVIGRQKTFQNDNQDIIVAAEADLNIGTLVWADDFEMDTPNSQPSNWIFNGNGTDKSNNYIDNTIAYKSTQSLKLYGQVGGCWGALAYHAIQAKPPFAVEVDVRNGNESLSGCHPYRADIGLREGNSWTNPNRMFVNFRGGKIYAGDDKTILADFSTLKWYKIKILYERPDNNTVKLSYWVNDIYKKSIEMSAISDEDKLLNLQLVVNEGTAWFDNVKVSNLKLN